MNFDKKIALITGATGGIGKAVSLELAQRGAEIILASRNMDKLEQTKQWLLNQCPDASVRMLLIDLSSMSSIKKAVVKLQGMVDRLDILINNAALIDPSSKEKRQSVDGHELMIATNYLGPVLLSKMCFSLLKSSDQAHILNVASIAVWKFYNPNKVLNFIVGPDQQKKYTGIEYYADSKMALTMYSIHMSEAFAEEGIRVNPLLLTNVQYEADSSIKLNLAHSLFNLILKPFKLSRGQAAKLFIEVLEKQSKEEALSQAFASNRKIAKLPAFALSQENMDSLVSLTEEALPAV